MQKNRGRKQARRHVAEIYHLVERIELSGVVEVEEDERNQAEDIKMQRLVRAAAPEIDEKTDHQVGTPTR